MNKGLRNEIKERKYNKRLDLYGLKNRNGKFHSFKSHSVPCSCSICKDEKFRDKRKKHSWKGDHFNYNQ